VFLDPADSNRVWVVFDRDARDYEVFLADLEVLAIARNLALAGPPIRADSIAAYDT